MTGVAVIGTGQWGKNHARVYKELQQEGVVEGLKICDLNESRVSELGGALGIEATTDYRQILINNEIHAVSIATPSKTHYQIAKEFMQAGKDVLIEKPMTMAVDEAKELIRIAQQNGRVLMVGHTFRYHPAVRELKRRIDAGELGEIQNMVGVRETFGLPRKDMGVIYALGIHELDLFCYLIGVDYPKSLLTATSHVYSRDIEDTAAIFMDFGRAKGYAFESWLMPVHDKRRELVVVGSKMSVLVDYLKPEELHLFDIRLVTHNGLPAYVENKDKLIVSLPYTEPLKEEIRCFISCVNSRRQPSSDGPVGLRAVTMVEAALASAKIGKAITFPL